MKRYYIYAIAILLGATFNSCKDEDDSTITGDADV